MNEIGVAVVDAMAIRAGREPMTSAAQTFGVTATQCTILESVRTRRPVRPSGLNDG